MRKFEDEDIQLYKGLHQYLKEFKLKEIEAGACMLAETAKKKGRESFEGRLVMRLADVIMLYYYERKSHYYKRKEVQ